MSDKRTQIIEASIDLFASKGFWNTPTARISEHASVSTGTLFNYFASKDALIDAVYLQLRQEQTAHLVVGYPEGATIREEMEHIWFRYIDWGVRNPVRYALVRQLKLSDLISEEARQQSIAELSFAHSLVERGIKAGIYQGISIEYFSHLVLAQLEAAVTYATAHNLEDMALARHITRAFEIFWTGVTS